MPIDIYCASSRQFGRARESSSIAIASAARLMGNTDWPAGMKQRSGAPAVPRRAGRPTMSARLVECTPDALTQKILRHHGRHLEQGDETTYINNFIYPTFSVHIGNPRNRRKTRHHRLTYIRGGGGGMGDVLSGITTGIRIALCTSRERKERPRDPRPGDPGEMCCLVPHHNRFRAANASQEQGFFTCS